jgi:hypothetical protein
MYVSAHLTGGIGNRLFEFAAALGLAEKWRAQPIFLLPCCGATNHGPFDTIFKMFPNIPVLETLNSWTRLEEPKGGVFTYTPFPESPSSGEAAVVCGWRQSPRYFPSNGVQCQLTELIDPTEWASLLKTYSLTDPVDRAKTVFLHVRLGDYKILPHHQVNLQNYYIQCLQRLPPQSRILFFSDEPELVREIFQHVVQALGHSFQCVTESDELKSLALMSQCWRGAITANSTFSWWGAYFARQRCPSPSEYLALYPDVWGQGLPPTTDVVPSWGIRVSVN